MQSVCQGFFLVFILFFFFFWGGGNFAVLIFFEKLQMDPYIPNSAFDTKLFTVLQQQKVRGWV